jgi:hypothetical protein
LTRASEPFAVSNDGTLAAIELDQLELVEITADGARRPLQSDSRPVGGLPPPSSDRRD